MKRHTPLQKLIAKEVADNGYFALDTMTYPNTNKIITGLMRLGFFYTWSGRFVGIAQTQIGARCACTWANSRHRIKRFDDAVASGSVWAAGCMLKGSL